MTWREDHTTRKVLHPNIVRQFRTITLINYSPARDDFCRRLITFANLAGWNQIRTDKTSVPLLNQTVWPSYIVPELLLLFFKKSSLRITVSKRHSNTPRLYCQWLNSEIYWLINHCMDWAWTGVTSFGRQFYFHDVIYHIRHCNVGTFFVIDGVPWFSQLLDVQNVRKNTCFSPNKSCGKF